MASSTTLLIGGLLLLVFDVVSRRRHARSWHGPARHRGDFFGILGFFAISGLLAVALVV